MVNNPNEGVCVPADWTPTKNRTDVFEGWSDHPYDATDPWQFSNFLIG